MVLIPVARDQLLPGLVAGKGDIAAGNITITPERRKLVDFTVRRPQRCQRGRGVRAGFAESCEP